MATLVPFTDTQALSAAIVAGYDLLFDNAFRSAPSFDIAVQKRVSNLNNPSISVTFETRANPVIDLTPIDERIDPSGRVLPNNSTTTVVAAEYGDFTEVTQRLLLTTIDSGFDTAVTDYWAEVARKTTDGLIEAALDAGANRYAIVGTTLTPQSSKANATAAATGVLTADAVRTIVAKFRATNVPTFDGANYIAFIDPRVSADFRSATDAAAWRAPQTYMDTLSTGIQQGEIGIFENVRFIETPNLPNPGNNSGGTRGYKTYFLGKYAVAGYEILPAQLVMDGVVVDALKRKMTVGWKAFVGYAPYRAESLYTVFTVSNHA